MTITPGETYRPVRGGPRIRVTAHTAGSNRVLAEETKSGGRTLSIPLRSFHASPTTRDGQPRRSGYVRENT